jgi:starch-binding outer membrane protein, SusD/RagB family
LGIPIQREYVKPEQIATYRPTRATQAEVIAFIESDLSAARALIPSNFTDISRITRNAVIGSQARVAQHVKNWQKVVDSASVVITAVPVSNPTVFRTIWTSRATPPGTEVIWKLNVTAANIGVAVGSLWQDLNGAVQASPAVKLLNTYTQATDSIRYNTFFRTPTTTTPSPVNLIAKYGAVIVGNNNPPENFEYDIKMMRTSELLLARAEAHAELNNIAAANTDLQTLRANRINNYVHVPITTKQALIDAILLERYKELCYEGQRYHDLRRRSLTISRDLSDVVGNTVIQNLPASNPKYILPIPQQEVFANPNIVQNPGY